MVTVFGTMVTPSARTTGRSEADYHAKSWDDVHGEIDTLGSTSSLIGQLDYGTVSRLLNIPTYPDHVISITGTFRFHY